MSAVLDAPAMTTDELLAMPGNGMEYRLIEGQLREKPMTIRNRIHSRIMVRSAYFLEAWRERQPLPRGSVLCGEAGCRLSRNPDTTVGIDVVYIAANLVNFDTDDTTLIAGVPTLVIEILSPSDVFEDIKEKIELYQKHRVPLIWVIDPYDRTVTIYRLDAEPELANVRQELSGEPFLPGFRMPVAEIFG
ncbi:MAG: Uma2 family endonuclease [Gemmataceae bacterium]|nr:Uma2 family endonuclease [Gemmataceae bacterium]